MEELLNKLGLSPKEASIYLYMLESPAQTASQIAKAVKEPRTNTYMVLERLSQKGLVIVGEGSAIRTYAANDPKYLLAQLQEKQRDLAQTRRSLDDVLPELISKFNLGQHRPGVVYLEGIDGLKASLEDMSKSRTDLLLWGSDEAGEDPEVWSILEKAGHKRRARGIATKTIFQKNAENWPHIHKFKFKAFEVRFWGNKPYVGEIVVYDNKVAITAYKPTIVVTVITNEIIADTFKAVFESCWEQATPLVVE